MNRVLSFCITIALLFASSACGAKKPPEQAAVKSKNVLAALRELDQAYEKRDLTAFLSEVSESFPARDSLAKSIEGVFAKYETIRFTIQYRRMVIKVEEKGRVRSTFTWDAEWTEAGGSTVKDGARVTLVFEPGSFKLAEIDGKNPFVPQPGETPGSKE